MAAPESGIGRSKAELSHVRPLAGMTLVAVPAIVLTPAETPGALQFRDQLMRDLDRAATAADMALINQPTGREPYVLRGYMSAGAERQGVKVSIIWDALTREGASIDRITRDQQVPARPGQDVWSAAASVNTRELAEAAIRTFKAASARAGEPRSASVQPLAR